MSGELKIDSYFDEHLKPVKIDGINTPLEISTKGLRITTGDILVQNFESKECKVYGDFTVDGNINMTASSGTRINMYGDVFMEATSTNEYLTINSQALFLKAVEYTDSNCSLLLAADSGYDARISFMEASGTNWSIGNDGGEATSTLSFSASAVLGTDEKMSLDGNGDLSVNNNITSGRDVIASRHMQVEATNAVFFDGGSNTYIAETASDDLEIVVGGKSMATFDEANGRVTMAAHKQTAALSDGTEFSATDSAYAGMILGYSKIFSTSTDSGDNLITLSNTAMTVLQSAQGTNVSVQFIVPPSGNVEIECTFWTSFVSRGAMFSLSTASSYSELDPIYTYDADWIVYTDETDHSQARVVFTVTGLTAGTDTTYYLAGLASSTYASIIHGRNRVAAEYFPPVIMKATALPATLQGGE